MVLATDLALMHLPVDDAAFRRDPMPYIEAARRVHPWLAKTDYGFFVHGYQAIKDLMYMDDKLVPNFEEIVEFYEGEGTPWAKFQVEQLMAHTGEKHRRIRMSVGDAFTPRNINRHLTLIRRNASALLDEWAPKGEFDFSEFASYFPISVLCGILGTTTEEIPRLRHSLETMARLHAMDRGMRSDLLASIDTMLSFCDNLIRERERSVAHQEGLLDQLVAVKAEGKIDHDELLYLLMVLFPAGYDTSKNMLTRTMHLMLDHPAYWRRCAIDREFCYKVTEETFRHTSTATAFRAVKTEFEYDGVSFPENLTLIFGNSVGGQDPRAFEHAGEFNPERVRANRHVAFGRGAHICLGQHMAKTQIAEGIHLMAQRIRNPRLTGQIVWRSFLGTWGLQTLPIAFDPAEARAEP